MNQRVRNAMSHVSSILVLGVLPLAACSTDTTAAEESVGSVSSELGTFSEFSAPVVLGSGVNNTYGQGCPFIAKDDRTLFYSSDEPGGLGALDLYVAHRRNKNSPWEKGVAIPVLNSSGREQCPTLTPDGRTLFFVSDRAGGMGGQDVYVSTRTNKNDDQGWSTPVNLTDINTASNDFSVAFLPGHDDDDCDHDDDSTPDRIYFSSNRPGGHGGIDLYTSVRQADGHWGPAVNVDELNTPSDDQRLQIRHDGREVFFESNRPGTIGGQDLFSATRDRDGHFSNIRILSEINSTANDGRPSISWDGTTLYWVSFRTDGVGGADIWSATRRRGHHGHGHDGHDD